MKTAFSAERALGVNSRGILKAVRRSLNTLEDWIVQKLDDYGVDIFRLTEAKLAENFTNA